MASPSHSPSRLHGNKDNPSMHDHVSDSLGDEHMNDFDATDMHDLYVDHEAFCHLLTRTTDLEKQVAGLNENISRMSDLYNQFMCQQAMSGRGENPARASGHGATPPVEVTPTTNGMGGAGTSAGDVPLAGEDGTPYEGHLTKADTVALLKNMTPPVFKRGLRAQQRYSQHLFT